MRRPVAFLFSRLQSFADDRRAVAATEFALLAPLLILLYFGATELSVASMTYRKVQQVSSMVDQLTIKAIEVDRADIDGIFNVSASVMQPFDAAGLRVKVTSVAIDASGRATVDWSRGLNETADAKGATFALPEGFGSIRSAWVIVSETAYEYRPFSIFAFDAPFTLHGRSLVRPRRVGPVVCTDC